MILIQMAKHSEHSLDAVFTALADSTRRGILEQLSLGEASVSQLAAPFGVALPTVHKHLRVLERAGFIAHEKRGRVRHVRLAATRPRSRVANRRLCLSPLGQVQGWIGQLERRWDHHLQQLERQVESAV
jgi:DNA-binding transcriptional ArsR family regulator